MPRRLGLLLGTGKKTFNREGKCDVTLPWYQNFWITTIESFGNDNGDGSLRTADAFPVVARPEMRLLFAGYGDGNENCKKAIGLY